MKTARYEPPAIDVDALVPFGGGTLKLTAADLVCIQRRRELFDRLRAAREGAMPAAARRDPEVTPEAA